MPERPLTIATYAAGASLAAITLVYVFGPTFFFDDEAANSSRSTRKKGVVGLSNPANDCFINSVLQALAGLPELRLYLIREVHRRKLDGAAVYKDLAAAVAEQRKKKDNTNNSKKQVPEWKLLGLQQGLVTAGLKEILDALNERPLQKKTISAQTFIRVVEDSFRTRISRTQQDAQEFLQLIAERLDDEYHAGRRVRRKSKATEIGGGGMGPVGGTVDSATATTPKQTVLQIDSTSPAGPRDSKIVTADDVPDAVDSGVEMTTKPEQESDEEPEALMFPFEGKLESQVECSFCQFKPKPHPSSFVTLTLHVPQNSGSLNACFDGMFKQEQIDDFTCDRCRLDHALQVNTKSLSKTTLTPQDRAALEEDKRKIEHAVREDPEQPPKGVKLPDLSTAPKRRISRHMRISSFPRILSLHLSRSVWDSGSAKNTSKVSFPETLSLGGLLDRKSYRLLAVVTHKGGHNSGHYETFRRQFLSAPYSTPASLGRQGFYSGVGSSAAPSPSVEAQEGGSLGSKTETGESQALPPDPRLSAVSSMESPSTSSSSSRSLQYERPRPTPSSIPLEAIPTPGLPDLPAGRPNDGGGQRQSSLSSAANRVRRRKGPDRWWRISDDKVKECKTGDVLGMQREVYLLFYDLVEEEGG